MKNLKEQIAELQKERINEIINDPTIDKLEKLYLLESEKLFRIHPIYINPFEEYEKLLKNTVNKSGSRIRNIFHDSLERHSVISFWEFFEDYFDDNYDEELVNDPTTLYPICEVENPFTGKIEKTKDEIIDIVFDFCIKHEVVGFTFDW